MIKRALLSFAALGLSATSAAQDTPSQREADARSPFIGRYDGGSFETAMGMEVRPDGTFAWGLSVGGLDVRAKGTWSQANGIITFVSDPKPIAPEFRWAGTETTPEAPLLKVKLPGGRELEYVDIAVLCTGENQSHYEIPEGGLQIDLEACAEPAALALEMPGGVPQDAQIFDLANQGWSKGQTAIVEFHRNDWGVLDFEGVTGRFLEGKLQVEGPLGAMTFRKVQAPSE